MEPALSLRVLNSVWPALNTMPSYILNSSSTKSHVPFVEDFVPSPSLRIQFPSWQLMVHCRRLSWLSSNLILQEGMRPICIVSVLLNVKTWSNFGPSINLSWILSLVWLPDLWLKPPTSDSRFRLSPWKKLTVRWEVPKETMKPFLSVSGTSSLTKVPEPFPRSLM